MKTNDLIGDQLDWAVAKCEGREYDGAWVENFSSNWLLCGPIIEREKIAIEPGADAFDQPWYATINRSYGGGPTPLIAAMRCFVTSKLGDTVEIPEELK